MGGPPILPQFHACSKRNFDCDHHSNQLNPLAIKGFFRSWFIGVDGETGHRSKKRPEIFLKFWPFFKRQVLFLEEGLSNRPVTLLRMDRLFHLQCFTNPELFGLDRHSDNERAGNVE
jgi:hypothetical protein